MKDHLRILGCWLLAEVLTLFIDLTLSFSGSALVRIICSVCTVGILLGLMAQGGACRPESQFAVAASAAARADGLCDAVCALGDAGSGKGGAACRRLLPDL